MIDDVDRVIVPGLTHWNHPGFLAYFANTGSAPGILGEMMAATLNVNAMLWRTSPAATELEQRRLRGCAELVGLPAGLFGQITDTASTSTLHRARRRPRGGRGRRARPRDGRPRRPAAAARVRLERGPLVGREGVHRAGARPARAFARSPATTSTGCGPTSSRRRSTPTSPPAGGRSRWWRRSARRRSTSIDPVAEIADVCARARYVAARRRRLRRRGGGRARAARRAGRLRAGRLDRHQPAQVAAHADGLRLL